MRFSTKGRLLAAATGAAGAALSAVAPPLGGGLVLFSAGMFGAAKKAREEERAAAGSPEFLGELNVARMGGRWALSSDLTPSLFALALPHYLERVLHNSDVSIATSFIAGLCARLEQLVPNNDARAFLANGGPRALFSGFREWGVPTPTFAIRAQLGRKPDVSGFLNGQLYFALTHMSPAQITQQDLGQSLVPLYERALLLPHTIATLTLQILRTQVALYAQHGSPTTERLGIAPNLATLAVFLGCAEDNRAHAEQAFSRYVSGQFNAEA